MKIFQRSSSLAFAFRRNLNLFSTQNTLAAPDQGRYTFSIVLPVSTRARLVFFKDNQLVAPAIPPLLKRTALINLQTTKVGLTNFTILQEDSTKQWIKFTENGNQLVEKADATKLKFTPIQKEGLKGYAIFSGSIPPNRVGVDTNKVGGQLQFTNLTSEDLFVLIPT